jgi:hypothetical protein
MSQTKLAQGASGDLAKASVHDVPDYRSHWKKGELSTFLRELDVIGRKEN